MKRYGKYGRKVGWIVKWYGKYRRNASGIMKIYGKYGRKVSWKVKRYGNYGRNVLKIIVIYVHLLASPITTTLFIYIPALNLLNVPLSVQQAKFASYR